MTHREFGWSVLAIVLAYVLAVVLYADGLLVPVLLVSAPLVIAGALMWGWLARHLHDEPTDIDRYCSRVDVELDEKEQHRRMAAAQERAAAASLRCERRVVAELRPGVRRRA